MKNEAELREQIVAAMVELDASGLNSGTSGNISVRLGDRFLMTPSGIPPGRLTPDSIVLTDFDGSFDGSVKPSSEWQMHGGVLAARPDVNAIVHCHSRFATTLACAGKTIPPLHYMTAVSGGAEIRLAPYETFGSPELARAIVATLDGRNACLMANHGQIAAARSLGGAMMIAAEIEVQASYYHGTLAIGGPHVLSDAAMHDVMVRFGTYGQK